MGRCCFKHFQFESLLVVAGSSCLRQHWGWEWGWCTPSTPGLPSAGHLLCCTPLPHPLLQTEGGTSSRCCQLVSDCSGSRRLSRSLLCIFPYAAWISNFPLCSIYVRVPRRLTAKTALQIPDFKEQKHPRVSALSVVTYIPPKAECLKHCRPGFLAHGTSQKKGLFLAGGCVHAAAQGPVFLTSRFTTPRALPWTAPSSGWERRGPETAHLTFTHVPLARTQTRGTPAVRRLLVPAVRP